MAKKKKNVPKDEYGNAGVRATLTNAGLADEKIGYDGEYVTYNGKRLMKPEYEKDGTSYAKQSDINSAINEAYKSEGVTIAPIAQLAGTLGVPQYAARFENGNVYLGGREVPSLYESNGIAYGDESAVREAAKGYRNDTGAKGYSEINERYDKRSDKVDMLLDAYLDRGDWSYDPESDPAYNAYAKAAQREGEKAYENILGNMSARTGGMLNSAAISAASAGYGNYLQSIQDKLPEFAKLSYERYKNDREADLEDILSMEDISGTRFDNDISATESANEWNRLNASDEFSRKNSELELSRNALYTDLYDEIMSEEVKSKEIDNAISGADVPYAGDIAKEKAVQAQQKSIGMAKENELTGADTAEKQADVIYRNAVVRGYFLPYEAEYLGIPEGTDPVSSYRRFLILGEV